MAPKPEREEPAQLAVAALAQQLQSVPDDGWLLVFLDLLDKADQATPSDHLIALIDAAYASSPPDDRTSAWRALLAYQARSRSELRGGDETRQTVRTKYEVLILVPKKRELEACQRVFESSGSPEMFDTHVRYRRFPLPGAEDKAEVTLVCMQREGNILAANVISDYVRAFGRPDLAVLCGMAAAPQEDEVKLGDVVIAESVIDTGPRRVTLDGNRTRETRYSVEGPLYQDLTAHIGDNERELMDSLIDEHVLAPQPQKDQDGGASYRPHVRAGVILAGDELVEDGSGETRATHDRAYALEMEGAGFAGACHHVNFPWMVVRGVADYAEPDRSKGFQDQATVAAASFVRSFLVETWKPNS